MKHWHIGIRSDGTRAVFSSEAEPTRESHGHLYRYTIGPFRLRRTAEYYKVRPNALCTSMADADRVARENLYPYS